MPLQLRLALLFTVFVALAAFGAGYGAQTVFRAVTRAQIEKDLAHEAKLLAEANKTASNPDQRSDVEDIPYVIPVALSAIAEPHPNRVQWFDTACQRVTYFAEQIAADVKHGDLMPLSDSGIAAIHKGQPWTDETTLPNINGLYLIYNQPIFDGNRVVGLAQVAESLERRYQNMAGLWQGLLLGGVALTLGAFGASWMVAGMCLRPLRRITNTANDIRITHDFSRRLLGPAQPERRRDEVSQLVTSVDAMLGELRAVHQDTSSQLHSQRQFLADVSHELRTPLTTIYGNLRLLERNLTSEDRDAVLHDAIDETERMSRLLHKLLQMARGEQTHALNCRSLALAPLLEDVMRKVAVLSYNRQVVLRTLARPQVQADADAIKQVLLILIDNALKFTSLDGQITVTLTCEHGQAQIRVLDTGPGMTQEQLQHIFERFYRGQDVQHTRGSGLGLAIAQELIAAHGGSISVASQRGHGSEFTLSLPLLTP